MQPDFGDRPRCFQPSLNSFNGVCPEEWTHNPDSEFAMYEQEQLTRVKEAASSGGGQIVSGATIQQSSSLDSSYHAQEEESGGSFSHFSGHSSGGSRYSGSGSSFGSSSASGKIVQIYPQRVGLKLKISKFEYGTEWRNGF